MIEKNAFNNEKSSDEIKLKIESFQNQFMETSIEVNSSFIQLKEKFKQNFPFQHKQVNKWDAWYSKMYEVE